MPYIAAANLIAAGPAVPEFCFHGSAGWEQVTTAAKDLWEGPARSECLERIAQVRRQLGEPGASERAAHVVGRFFRTGPASPSTHTG